MQDVKNSQVYTCHGENLDHLIFDSGLLLKGGSIHDQCRKSSCLLFPTCQVRVSRFYQSCLLLPSFLPFFLPPSFFSSGTAGSQLRVADVSGHCRTSAQTPERMPEYRSEQMPEGQIKCQNKCQKECQIECQNKYAVHTSRWYVRNCVRIVFQGGDHSNKVFFCG